MKPLNLLFSFFSIKVQTSFNKRKSAETAEFQEFGAHSDLNMMKRLHPVDSEDDHNPEKKKFRDLANTINNGSISCPVDEKTG